MKFTHLHNHTHYSLLDGLTKVDALVERAKALGMDALAITDHGNMYGAVEFFKKCGKEGIKPIIGCELYVATRTRHDKDPNADAKRYHLTILVKNDVGYKNLCQLITKSNFEGFYYKPRVDHELIEKYHEGLIALSGCAFGEVARKLAQGADEEAETIARFYKNIFGDDFYIEIQSHMTDVFPKVVALARKLNVPLVATQDDHYLYPNEARVQAVLKSVQSGKQIGEEKIAESEAYDLSFRSEEEMREHFKELPEAIENTAKVVEKCNFQFSMGKYILPKFPLPDGYTSDSYFEKLLAERLHNRYPNPTQEVLDRLAYEARVIKEMGFVDYFLIVQDFVVWAKNSGIVVGPGRGSAAGCMVSYILGITEVDPIEYKLIFERFLNPGRISMPDIDLDFADKRRNEMFGYLKDKYGEENIAQIITFGTMAARAAVRDAGRALGMPYSYCDKISKLIPFVAAPGKETFLPKYLVEIPELKEMNENDPQAKKLFEIAIKFEGIARHTSVHACGTVISNKPLTEYMPLQKADEDTVVTQYEGHAIEDLGLLKMDLLGLRNLTIIEECLQLIKELHGKSIDINKIPFNDKKTFALFQRAETIGIFQFESSGMRRYMKELKPTELEDLIALVALYRPGPMEKIPSFIARKHGKEEVAYLHPLMEPILKNTYGISVYQEQMMEIAKNLADFTLAEADTLRKAIGKKIKKLLDEQEVKLIGGMMKKGIDEATAKAIWALFPDFAKYGFNRSHAACYAFVAYRTAYLKANYPVEYATALFNNAQGDVERIGFLVNEAKHMNIEILRPDINCSSTEFTPEGNNVRYGLASVKNVGAAIAEALVAERKKNGPYKNFVEVLARVTHKDLNKKSLESLTKAGVFDSLGTDRATILGNIETIVKKLSGTRKSIQTAQIGLFGAAAPAFTIRLEPKEPISITQLVQWEKELVGFYVSNHPLEAFLSKERMKNEQFISIHEASEEKNEKKRLKIAGSVSQVKRIMTKKGDPMVFAKLEDMSDNIEIVIFPDIFSSTAALWEEGKLVKLIGNISKKDGETKIICQEAKIIDTTEVA